MPTLLSSAATAAPTTVLGPANPSSPQPGSSATAITLSLGGVDFCLCPSDSNAEVSYKYNNSPEGVLLSLKSFTGTLFVSSKATAGRVTFQLPEATAIVAPTTSNTTTAKTDTTTTTSTTKTLAKVEEEPDSPEAVNKGVHISPGQQKLPFTTTKGTPAAAAAATKKKSGAVNHTAAATKKSAKKNTAQHSHQDRKRTSSSSSFGYNENDDPDKTPKTHSSKRSRRGGTDGDDHDGALHSTMLLMCEQPSQSTQEEADEQARIARTMPSLDISQTIDSNSNYSNTNSCYSNTDHQSFDSVAENNTIVTTNQNSVQDILNQVNSTNNSIASVREDDEEVATHVEEDDNTGKNTATTMMEENKENVMDTSVAASNPDQQQKATTLEAPDASTVVVAAAVEEFNGYPPPPPRWGHTMTKIQDDQLLVYGGQSFDKDGNPVILSDVHIYDPKKGSWDKPINCRGEARQWHTATYIPGRQQIIAFGGETIDLLSNGKNSKKVIASDTLRVLDTEIMLWYPPAVSGDVPSGRSGHSATFFPDTNELVIFGGVRGSKWLNTVSVLDITRWIWTTPKVDGVPPKARSYHSATVVGNKIVIFGGNNKTSCFNSVHVLESVAGDSTEGCSWKWSHPTTKGKARPFPRTGHSATLLDDGHTICIYGGWDPNEEGDATGEDNMFKGSYLLDTRDWTWKEGPKPEPFGSGSANHTVEDCGPKRCGHAAALNPVNGEVLVMGGRCPGEFLAGDLQKLVPLADCEREVGLEG